MRFLSQEFRTGIEFVSINMGSEDAVPLVETVNVAIEAAVDR